jgi:hypothetical protein
MNTIRVVSLKDFTIGLVLALAEKEFLVIDKPENVLHAAIESAYEAIRDDVEEEQEDAKFHASLSAISGGTFEPVEIIDYALGAKLMTCEPQQQALGVVRNECFTKAYFGHRPTHGPLYGKAAQAFIDYTE